MSSPRPVVALNKPRADPNHYRTQCAVDGCVKPCKRNRRLCSMHEARLQRHGTTDPTPRSHAPLIERYWRKVVRTTEGCWDWTGAINSAGYTFLDGDKYGHRLSYQIHHGPIPAGMEVMHTCDNRRCTKPEHLTLGTHADNMRDAKVKGRTRGPSKLTEEQVREIRNDHAAGGATPSELAARFGVARTTVYGVLQRQTWRRL